MLTDPGGRADRRRMSMQHRRAMVPGVRGAPEAGATAAEFWALPSRADVPAERDATVFTIRRASIQPSGAYRKAGASEPSRLAHCFGRRPSRRFTRDFLAAASGCVTRHTFGRPRHWPGRARHSDAAKATDESAGGPQTATKMTPPVKPGDMATGGAIDPGDRSPPEIVSSAWPPGRRQQSIMEQQRSASRTGGEHRSPGCHRPTAFPERARDRAAKNVSITRTATSFVENSQALSCVIIRHSFPKWKRTPVEDGYPPGAPVKEASC